jgi:hypothetical protein
MPEGQWIDGEAGRRFSQPRIAGGLSSGSGSVQAPASTRAPAGNRACTPPMRGAWYWHALRTTGLTTDV